MELFGFEFTRSASKEQSQKTKKRKNKRGYDGASLADRLGGWYAAKGDQNAISAKDLPTLRDRSRELRRNNAVASRGLAVITSNVVGKGIKTQFRPIDNAKKLDTRLEKNWKAWTSNRNFDFDQRHNLYSMQRLVMDAVTESGEVLIRKKYNSALRFPLTYQILESDFIDTNIDGVTGKNGNRIIQGIEFDKKGKRVAYHLFEEHPGGYFGGFTMGSISTQSVRVPIEEIYHIYKVLRPGQVRGIPWLAPVMVRIKDADEFEDAQLMKQKIAAMFTAFVRDINAEFRDEDEDCGEDLGATLQPGLIEELPPGKTIDFSNPPSVEHYPEYMTSVYKTIAAGLGITYESLTSDLSNVNFSSGRMGWIEMGRNIDMWREEIISFQFLDLIARDFLDLMSLEQIDVSNAGYVHTPPRRQMIDPVKETNAVIAQIRAGLTTLSGELMAQGLDPEDVLAQIQKDNEKIDELELTLDSDGRNTTAGGKLQDASKNIETEKGGVTDEQTQN